MTPRKRKSRVYWREQGGARRAWFDGRDYAEVGGTREPLVPPGERLATTDPDVATQLLRLFEGKEVGGCEVPLFGHVVEVESIEAFVVPAGLVVFRKAEGAPGLLPEDISLFELRNDLICHLLSQLIEFLISSLS